MLCHFQPLPGYCGLRGHANELDLAFYIYGPVAVPFDSSLCHLSQAEEHQPREHARHPPDGKAKVSSGKSPGRHSKFLKYICFILDTSILYGLYVCISWMSANFK